MPAAGSHRVCGQAGRVRACPDAAELDATGQCKMPVLLNRASQCMLRQPAPSSSLERVELHIGAAIKVPEDNAPCLTRYDGASQRMLRQPSQSSAAPTCIAAQPTRQHGGSCMSMHRSSQNPLTAWWQCLAPMLTLEQAQMTRLVYAKGGAEQLNQAQICWYLRPDCRRSPLSAHTKPGVETA